MSERVQDYVVDYSVTKLEETARIFWELEKSGYRVRSEVESNASRNSFTCGSSAY